MPPVQPISHPPSAVSASPRSPWPHLRREASAFTLLELILALAAGMLIIGIAVLSIGSIGKERELRNHAGVLEATARGALMESIRTGRPHSMLFESDRFSLGEKSHLLPGSTLLINRPGIAGWRPPSENGVWTFHPSGICEPIAVQISSGVGKVEIQFDPLTAAAESTAVEIFSAP